MSCATLVSQVAGHMPSICRSAATARASLASAAVARSGAVETAMRPLLRNLRGPQAQVTVLGNNFTITTNRYVFNLLQTEAVSERVLPAVLRVGLYDDAGEAVSAVELVSLDSDSQNLDQRQRKVILTLLNRPFSSSERYFLKLLDAETDVEQFRIDVRINLAISNDFDF